MLVVILWVRVGDKLVMIVSIKRDRWIMFRFVEIWVCLFVKVDFMNLVYLVDR